MKIINLVKGEFIKNYNIKKILLILIVLLISIMAITILNCQNYNDNHIENQLSYYKTNYDQLKKNEITANSNFELEYMLYDSKINIELLESLKNYKKITSFSFQSIIINKIIIIEKINFLAQKYLENNNISLDFMEMDIVKRNILKLKTMNNIEIENYLIWLNNIKEKYKQLLDENKYYKYLEFQIELDDTLIEDDRYLLSDNYYSEYKSYYKLFIDQKIEDENYFNVQNLYQKINLCHPYSNSEKLRNILDKENDKRRLILEYSIEHDLKQDITYNDYGLTTNFQNVYITAKSCVNQIFDLSVIVLLLVILTSGDIITKEHSKGTDKMLFTSSNKRYKIHLSKFIYLVLNTFIIWFIALILISIYAGLKFGFTDLFTSKIIYFNDSILKVNYYLYTIGKIIYISIPLIAILAVLFMLSTITLNTVLVIGSSVALTVISPFLWHLINHFQLSFLAYTVFPYIMFNEVLLFNENYVKVAELTNISKNFGIIISIITIIICYIISNIIYIKRDIKN